MVLVREEGSAFTRSQEEGTRQNPIDFSFVETGWEIEAGILFRKKRRTSEWKQVGWSNTNFPPRKWRWEEGIWSG